MADSSPTADVESVDPIYRESYSYDPVGDLQFWRVYYKVGLVLIFFLIAFYYLFFGYLLWKAAQLLAAGNPMGIIMGGITLPFLLIGVTVVAAHALKINFMREGKETITVDRTGVTIESAGYFNRHIKPTSIESAQQTESCWPGGAETMTLSVNIRLAPMLLGGRFYAFRGLVDRKLDWWGREGEPGVVIETDDGEVRVDTDRPAELVQAIDEISASSDQD